MLKLVDGENKIGINEIKTLIVSDGPIIIMADGVMFALAETVMMPVDADMVNLYLVETVGEITKYSPDPQSESGYL